MRVLVRSTASSIACYAYCMCEYAAFICTAATSIAKKVAATTCEKQVGRTPRQVHTVQRDSFGFSRTKSTNLRVNCHSLRMQAMGEASDSTSAPKRVAANIPGHIPWSQQTPPNCTWVIFRGVATHRWDARRCDQLLQLLVAGTLH